MTREEIFAWWAPPDSIWQPWVKPVLFSQMRERVPADGGGAPLSSGLSADVGSESGPPPPALPAFSAETAIVVDLPGEQSVAIGLSLAKIGFRPVPLFNACPAPTGMLAAVNVQPTLAALAAGTSLLINARLRADVPPAFLLDARRRAGTRVPVPGTFDNRSISLPTDFPSANLLLSRGISSVVLMSTGGAIEADLAHTLLRWQQAGVTILNNETPPQRLTIRRPSHFRWLWQNTLAMLGLRRNPLGGFGGVLPMSGGVG